MNSKKKGAYRPPNIHRRCQCRPKTPTRRQACMPCIRSTTARTSRRASALNRRRHTTVRSDLCCGGLFAYEYIFIYVSSLHSAGAVPRLRQHRRELAVPWVWRCAVLAVCRGPHGCTHRRTCTAENCCLIGGRRRGCCGGCGRRIFALLLPQLLGPEHLVVRCLLVCICLHFVS